MTASELIAKLEELKSEHGDLPVCLYDMRWDEHRTDITVSILEPWVNELTGKKIDDGLEDGNYIWIDWG